MSQSQVTVMGIFSLYEISWNFKIIVLRADFIILKTKKKPKNTKKKAFKSFKKNLLFDKIFRFYFLWFFHQKKVLLDTKLIVPISVYYDL